MAKTSRARSQPTLPGSTSRLQRPESLWPLLGLLFLAAAFLIYSPALRGPFLFDDFGLPYATPNFEKQPLRAWLAGVRPVLMLSYWANFAVAGRDTATYHVTNLLLHVANSLLVFLLLARVGSVITAEREQAKTNVAAAIASALFLLHPLQTESVAYVAGRSELLCALFSLAAMVLFAGLREKAISWTRAFLILALYACAVLSKEQAIVLPVAFLVMDVTFRKQSLPAAIRHGARLYGALAVAGVLAGVKVASVLASTTTAGFGVSGVSPLSYLYTQFRVWLMYLRLLILPFGQNADYDLPLSRSLLEHGSGLALLVLLALAALAWRVRDRYPLLPGGLLLFAILLAPTSSIVPIRDFAAERRMYLPLAGLMIVMMQLLIRARITTGVAGALAGGFLIYSALTYERAKVWSSDIAFWTDTVARSSDKARGYSHLLYAYIRAQRCGEAVKVGQRFPSAIREDPEFLGVLGNAYICDGKMAEAAQLFQLAAQREPSVGRYLALAASLMALGRPQEAEAAEQKASQIPARSPYDFEMMQRWNNAKEQSRSRSGPTGS